jgi:hypothetical protein
MTLPGPTRIKDAAQTCVGTAGMTCWSTVIRSVARPSDERAVTVHLSALTLAGAVRRQVTGAAPPGGIVTVSGAPRATAGWRSTLAVTVIGFSLPLRSVKVAP